MERESKGRGRTKTHSLFLKMLTKKPGVQFGTGVEVVVSEEGLEPEEASTVN